MTMEPANRTNNIETLKAVKNGALGAFIGVRDICGLLG